MESDNSKLYLIVLTALLAIVIVPTAWANSAVDQYIESPPSPEGEPNPSGDPRPGGGDPSPTGGEDSPAVEPGAYLDPETGEAADGSADRANRGGDSGSGGEESNRPDASPSRIVAGAVRPRFDSASSSWWSTFGGLGALMLISLLAALAIALVRHRRTQ